MKTSNTINFFCFFFLLLFTWYSAFSQHEHPFVKLKPKKKGKRVELYVINTDTISYDVFLKITTNNYRRSSNRPILRTIPAKTKIKINTIIHMPGMPETYDTVFIVNEVSNSIKIRKNKENFNLNFDNALNKTKIKIFTKNDCFICPKIKSILNSNKIPYEEHNIDIDTSLYHVVIKELRAIKPNSNYNKIPMMKIGDFFYNDINSIDNFLIHLKDGLKIE